MEDSRYQDLEKRNVSVRLWVQSKASVAGTKRIKGAIRKNEAERTRHCWILQVTLESFVFIPATRSW